MGLTNLSYSTTRMNLPLSKWALVFVFTSLIIIICVKISNIWSSRRDIPFVSTVKDIYLQWSDNLNEGVVYYREIIPKGKAKLDILLLHGMSFSSKNWLEINTLNILASHGYRVIALDLPGYGKSSYKVDTTHTSRSEFLWQFIKKTGLDSPVIVSPSMSGIFSLSYIAAHKPVKGFVAIAVVHTNKIPVEDYAHFPPTLIVHGSKDKGLGVKSTDVLSKNVPDNSVKVIDNAGHACYLDEPEEFHAMLLVFLKSL